MLSLWKLHGCGNSFVIGSSSWESEAPLNRLAAWISSPGFGIGSDGALFVSPPSSTGVFEVQMFNPDGSLMGMCGNGIRCVVRFLVLENQINAGSGAVQFLVEGRAISCKYSDHGKWVEVDMGAPQFEPSQIPVRASAPKETLTVDLATASYEGMALSMGNPHFVVQVPDLKEVPLAQVGPQIEHHRFFPKRVNVEFVKVTSRAAIEIAVWERGAGATLACGTGACAAAVALIEQGRASSPLTVILPGGKVIVSWSQGERVILTGPAQEVCKIEQLTLPIEIRQN